MEMRKETTERKRRKILHKNAELVRSVKPGQSAVPVWQRDSSRPFSTWKMNPAA
jgi:hypothetical protein